MNDPPVHVWGDSVDVAALCVFFTVVFGLPVAGFVFASVDLRRYLRSLRRTISTLVLRDYSVPEWARPKTPRCLVVFGLGWPCTREELLRAYRDKIKSHHPDRGGDQRRFLALQAHFEEALQMVRQREEAGGQLGDD